MSTIAIDYSRGVAEHGTGVTRYTQAIVRELIRLDSPHSFTLYTPERPPTVNPSGRVIIRELKPRRPFSTIAVSLALLRDRPDLYFSPSGELPLVAPTRIVATVHDLAWRVHPADYQSREITLNEWVTRRIARQAAAIITPSEVTRRDLIRHFDVEATRVTAIPYGVDPSFERLPAHPSPVDAPFLLAIGTHRRKRLGLLVKSFGLLKEEHLPHTLVIIGALNPTDQELQEALDQLGPLRGSVRLTGYLSDDEVKQYVSRAEAVIMVSRYEGFGLPILEAMAARVPVVLSRIPVFEEVAGSAALYLSTATPLELAATVSRLLHSPKLRLSLISKGRARVSRFSWTRTAERTLEVMETVLT